MEVLEAPPFLEQLAGADPLIRQSIQWYQERLRDTEAQCQDLRDQLKAQEQRVEALQARLQQAEGATLPSDEPSRRRASGPILNVPPDVWEQTPPLVRDLLIGLYQQLRHISARPPSDPVLDLPLEVWSTAHPLIQERLIGLCHQVDALSQQIELLRSQVFGSRSERLPRSAPDNSSPSSDGDQGQESEQEREKSAAGSEASRLRSPGTNVDAESQPEAGKTPRRRGFRKLPSAELPRVEEIHDVPETEKQCGCGAIKSHIGADTASRVQFVSAHCRVLVHKRLKYACRKCEGFEDVVIPSTEAWSPGAEPVQGGSSSSMAPERGGSGKNTTGRDGSSPASAARRPVVTIAPGPRYLIPKGIATSSLLAHIIVSKFLDSLPLYRQQEQFARMGLRLVRSTMCRWLLMVSAACVPLMAALRKEVLSGRIVSCDESTIQVLHEPNRSATSKSYMWTFRGGTEDKPAIEFVYSTTRGAEVPKHYLRGFRGAVQTDGYAGYDFLDEMDGIVHLGCMSHARRKFVDVLKALGKGWKKNLRGVAGEAILLIRELYALERIATSEQMSETERYELRQQKARPIMDHLHELLINEQGNALPASKLGEAIGYTLNQWPRLERYLNAGHYRIDNNLVENVFRTFAVGRKNWLFSHSQKGAEANACFYSLILTAKANGLDPFYYLNAVCDRLPYANCEEDYRALLPQYIDRKLLQPVRA